MSENYKCLLSEVYPTKCKHGNDAYKAGITNTADQVICGVTINNLICNQTFTIYHPDETERRQGERAYALADTLEP